MFSYYLKLGLRSLRRNPVLTGLMIITVAFGVAASMTTYSVLRGMSGDPIPWKSSKLFFPQIDVWGPQARNGRSEPAGAMDYIDAAALLRGHRAPKQAAIYGIAPTVYPKDPQRKSVATQGHAVSADFFSMAEPTFLYGSAWSANDEEHRSRLAVISKLLNQRLFGGVDSVGKEIHLDDGNFRIVGVLDGWHPQPRFYDLATNDAFGPADQLFVPFATAIDMQMNTNGGFGCGRKLSGPGFAGVLSSDCVWISYMVELDGAAEVRNYRNYLDGYAHAQQASGRFGWPPNNRLRDLRAWMDFEQVVPPELKVSIALAFCLLLVCMVNAVGLLLAKFMRRSSEIGVRRALGASRLSIAAQFGVESAAIGLAGGLMGVLITWGGTALMRSALPSQVANLIRIDSTLLAQTLLLAIVAMVLTGLYPTWRASRVTPALQLKTD
ncbi:MAG: ABC transporter permease [Pseudomonadota bacterium]|nr:ABC transporter permease [Pseudomonadota bacterium]